MPPNLTFAFVIHPAGFGHFGTFWRRAGLLPMPLLKKVHAFFPPKIIPLGPIRSRQGLEVRGYAITLAFTPDSALGMNDVCAARCLERIEKITSALRVDILGIGGSLGIRLGALRVKPRGPGVPTTFGRALTAWSLFEAICRASVATKTALSTATVALCDIDDESVLAAARMLADEAGRLILVSSDEGKLKRASDALAGVGTAEVSMEQDPIGAFRDADVIVTAADLPDIDFSLECVKPGACIFNLSSAPLCSVQGAPQRKITVFKAGLVKLPFKISFSSDAAMPADVVPAAFAETILMAFEGRKQPYACPDALNFYAMEEIADAAARHGIEVYLPESPAM